jgi:hypothetical protein
VTVVLTGHPVNLPQQQREVTQTSAAAARVLEVYRDRAVGRGDIRDGRLTTVRPCAQYVECLETRVDCRP